MKNLTKLFFCLFMIVMIVPLSAVFANHRPPQRIISCMPSITEMLFALGLGDRIVGVTLNCNYPVAAQKKEKVGREVINVEKVISLQPDLVVMLKNAQPREIEKLKKRNLPVMVINPQTINEVMETIIELGKITGQSQPADKLVKQMKARLLAIKKKREPRVLVLVGVNPLVVVGGNNFIDDIIKTAGGNNLARKLSSPYPQYSLEQLVRDDPDVLVIVKSVVLDEKQIYNDKRWNILRAVKEKKVLLVDADVLSRPGPRVVEAVELCAAFFAKN